MIRQLSNRQLATVLAALRLWQADVTDHDDFPAVPVDFADFFEEHSALESGEIDQLCEHLNIEQPEPRFAIGTKFKTPGKHSRTCTVTDIFKTYNARGELVKVTYQAKHEFAGQTVTNNEVADSTIFRNLINRT